LIRPTTLPLRHAATVEGMPMATQLSSLTYHLGTEN